MTEMEWLARVLEASVKRKGEVPLTNLHLLNIIRMAARAKDQHEQAVEDSLNEMMAEEKKWGSS